VQHTEPEFVTTAQAAAILRCSPENIRRLANRAALPVAHRVGRNQRLFERREVEQLAAARRRRRKDDEEP
jgi:excisionase family DNA binding protein